MASVTNRNGRRALQCFVVGCPKITRSPLKLALLCTVCGTTGKNVCSQCKKARYCHKDHQILDWKSGHKEACKSTISENPAASKDALFPETELVDEEEPDWKEEILKSAKEKYGTERELEGPEDSDEEEAVDTSIGVDKAFLKFQKRVGVAPDQVVRYGRTGWTSPEDPLYVSDLGKPENIPACSICRTPREFEFQLMPQLLNHLGINSYSPDALDWGTVLVYSCPRHCRIEIGAYQPEFIWRQDFSADGMVPGQLEEVKKEDEDDVK